MHHDINTPTSAPRKVRLLPGLRLELCDHAAEAQLTPDEALGLANSLVLNSREALHQAATSAHQARPRCGSLNASATPDCVTLALWRQGFETVATLSRAQSDALAKTITSQSGRLQIGCAIDQFKAP